MDAETSGLAVGSAVNVVSLFDARCPAGAGGTSFVRRTADGADADDDAHLLAALLACENVPRLVTFNGTAFDFQQIAAGVRCRADKTRAARLALSSFDLLLDFTADNGYMSSLDSFATASLGEAKSGTGMEAVVLWAAGDHAAVAKYCENDARITAALHAHGMNLGRLSRTTKSGKVSTWALRPCLFRTAEDALVGHARKPPDVSWMSDPPDVASLADWVLDLLA